MRNTNAEISGMIADICESLMNALMAKGFERHESVAIVCAAIGRSNVEISGLPAFVAPGTTQH